MLQNVKCGGRVSLNAMDRLSSADLSGSDSGAVHESTLPQHGYLRKINDIIKNTDWMTTLSNCDKIKAVESNRAGFLAWA